jgi:3-oxoisoapionate decarboxylase
MQLGLSSYSFPWAVGVTDFKPHKPLTAGDILHFAAEQSIAVVQFADNYPLHTLSEEALQGVIKTARIKNIKIEVGARGLTRKMITSYLPVIRLMETFFLRMVIDDVDYHPSEQQVMRTIADILPELKAHNVMLAIENHDRFSSKTLKRIIEDTDPEWVGICLDTANSFGAGEGIHEVVSHLAPYTVNVHVKDFTIDRVSHKMGFRIRGAPAGAGMLDIPWLLNELRQSPLCKTATLEVWSDPASSIEETIGNERNWVMESIAYLKTLLS